MERSSLVLVFFIFSTLIAQNFSDIRFDVSTYLEEKKKRFSDLPKRSPNIEPVNYLPYVESCSDCHIAYSRGLLPERSWKMLLSQEGLADHFDEYLEIEEPIREEIESHLIAGSVEKSIKYYISRKVKATLKSSETPLRISELGYIWRQHRDIPSQYIVENAKVLSLSQCSACHIRVDKGILDKDEVYIPYGMLK